MQGRRDERVCGRWRGVVREAQPVPIPAAPFVEKTLISAIPGAVDLEELVKLVKFLLARRQDQDTRVEDIWPADVGDCRELVGEIEQMVQWFERKNICIQEDDLGILGKAKDV